MTGTIFIPTTTIAGITPPIQVPYGYTLAGIECPELTATAFTITHCERIDGTFLSLKDGLGIYTTAGNAIPFTMGATSLGVMMIPPTLSVLLNSFMKINLTGSSEVGGFGLIFKSLA